MTQLGTSPGQKEMNGVLLFPFALSERPKSFAESGLQSNPAAKMGKPLPARLSIEPSEDAPDSGQAAAALAGSTLDI